MFPFYVQIVGPLALVAVIATDLLRRTLTSFSLWRKGLREPPGPRPYFLIANLLDLPTNNVHIGYARMAKRYGPIMRVSTPTSTIIILSNPKVVLDILDKQGGISSDRPSMHMAKLAGWSWGVSVMNQGPELRARRKIMHHHLDQRVIARYNSLITQNVLAFADRVLVAPDGFFSHAKHASGATILKIAYGMEISGHDDPYVKLAEDGARSWASVVTPGIWVVDTIPISRHLPRWFPFLQFHRYAEEHRKYAENMLEIPFAWTRKEMEKGSFPPSMVSEYLSKDPKDKDNAMKDAAGFMYLGGMDSTATVVHCFFLMMTLNPEIQKTAHDEIDRVIGSDRLPTFADRKSLPYMKLSSSNFFVCGLRGQWVWTKDNYVLKPLHYPGVPHILTQDLVYNGMILRRGSVLLANIWGILHDPETYPDPHTFNPERFLRNNKIDDTVLNPKSHVFGYGRRICPGQYLADSSLFIEIAILLACFDIRKKRENGVEITPETKFSSTALSALMPFSCSISPRSDKIAPLIAHGLEALVGA